MTRSASQKEQFDVNYRYSSSAATVMTTQYSTLFSQPTFELLNCRPSQFALIRRHGLIHHAVENCNTISTFFNIEYAGMSPIYVGM